MGLSVMFVSGPRGSGKSAVIRAMIDRLWKSPPHYIRLVVCGSDKRPPKPTTKTAGEFGVATARWLEYDPERIFEMLPAALAEIHRKDRFGSVVIEADADPALRCAYSYDHRVFVMPMPADVKDVFRDPERAAEELRRVLDDTVAFASEIFGLFSDEDERAREPSEERPEMSAANMRSFLYSPLGDELATRIQLQPPYHGLVESDVIIVNSKVGVSEPQTKECVRRIQQLLERIRGVSGRRAELYFCDPFDQKGPDCRRLLKALKPMCKGGR